MFQRSLTGFCNSIKMCRIEFFIEEGQFHLLNNNGKQVLLATCQEKTKSDWESHPGQGVVNVGVNF